MKILHVCVSLPDVWGGPPRALATMARAQAAAGADVVVLPSSFTPGPQTLEPGDYGKLKVLHPPATGALKWYNGKLKRELRRAAADRDIVHVHGTWRYHTLGAAGVARGYGIPYVVRPAGNLGEVTRRHKAYLKMPYFELIERPVLNRAAALHCTSRKEQDELAGVRLRPRTFIVPQPIANESAGVAPDLTGLRTLCCDLRWDGMKRIVYLGRISFIKSIDLLLEGFIRLAAEFQEWTLILAGPPEDAEIADALSRRARAAGLRDRVAVPGMVRGATKAALLSSADVFAQPSKHENFGISVAEALFFGVPCLVSDGVALAQDIREADAGGVFISEPAAIAAALRPLLMDDALRARQASAARTLARKFDPASVAEQLQREYERCLVEKRTP